MRRAGGTGFPRGLYVEGVEARRRAEEAALPRPSGAAAGAHPSPRARLLPRAPSGWGPQLREPRGTTRPRLPVLPLAAGLGWVQSGCWGEPFRRRRRVHLDAPLLGRYLPRARTGGRGRPGFGCARGRAVLGRLKGPCPPPPAFPGIPGPLRLFTVGNRMGLGDPTQPPPVLSQVGEMDARRAVSPPTARQCLFCDTMLHRVVGN